MILHEQKIWGYAFIDSVKLEIQRVRPLFIKENKNLYTSGRRFSTDDRVLRSFLSLVIDDLNDRAIPNDTKHLERMATVLLGEIVWKAFLECSSADRWYDFEKDWG